MNASYFNQTDSEALDFVINAIQKRFEQSNYQAYAALENLLIKAVNNEDFSMSKHL